MSQHTEAPVPPPRTACRTAWWRLLLLLAALIPGQVVAQDTNSIPATNVFAHVREPLVLAPIHPDAIFNRFTGYQPRNKSGGIMFLTLPFMASGESVTNSSPEALAFAFTLSFALDWHPLGATTRHAYFTFKRQPALMRKAGEELTHEPVASAVEHWGASHAVGGTLHHVGDGRYACTYQLFDREGALMRTGTTATNDFFAVVGDAAVAIMRTLHYRVPPALADYLRIPRCTNAVSLTQLGQAAFIEERSDTEFKQYADILARDPGFGEVTYWWANQAYWVDLDAMRCENATLRSVEAYVTPAAFAGLRWSVPEFVPAEAVKEAGWLAHVESLVGDSHPLVVHAHLDRLKITRHNNNGPLLQRALAVAQDNPDDFALMVKLADALIKQQGPLDFAMAASLAGAALRSPSIPSDFARDALLLHVAQGFYWSGYFDRALAPLHGILSQTDAGNPNATELAALELAWLSLAQMGHHEAAANLGLERLKLDTPPNTIRAAVMSWCALLANRHGLIADIEKVVPVRSNDWAHIAFALSRTLAGGGPVPEWPTARDQNVHVTRQEYVNMATAMSVLARQAQSNAHGGREPIPELMTLLRKLPNTRPAWIELDALDRHTPGVVPLLAFYEVLHWLHGDDAWVREAYAAFRARNHQPPPDRAAIAALFSPLPGAAWPLYGATAAERRRTITTSAEISQLPLFAGAWLIKSLLADRRYAEARTVCQNLLLVDFEIGAKAFHSDLLHLIDEAERLNTTDDIPALARRDIPMRPTLPGLAEDLQR